VLEQLRVEGVDDEVAVEEDEHRVLPGLARRGDEQRLGRRQRARAGRGRRRAAPAPRRRPGLVDPGEPDAVAPEVEHAAARLRPHEQQQAVRSKEQQSCRRGAHVNGELGVSANLDKAPQGSEGNNGDMVGVVAAWRPTVPAACEELAAVPYPGLCSQWEHGDSAWTPALPVPGASFVVICGISFVSLGHVSPSLKDSFSHGRENKKTKQNQNRPGPKESGAV